MHITLSVIKSDIGYIGGHIKPSSALIQAVRDYLMEHSKGIVFDFDISHTGDDIAILMTHTEGKLEEAVHKLPGTLLLPAPWRPRNRACTAPTRACSRMRFPATSRA